jgi:hypothetical protein
MDQRGAEQTPSLHLGGGERDRTDGLLVANQALSHLSYTPDPEDAEPGSQPELRGGPR